ncbi:hypothetical protein AMECASPLE_035300 [Ameca splendens]|uniref:Uncharacterized protein n=1 Tax=Ameca splendens TaxID=208324 RepID=A0ABV1A3H9_9TELE
MVFRWDQMITNTFIHACTNLTVETNKSMREKPNHHISQELSPGPPGVPIGVPRPEGFCSISWRRPDQMDHLSLLLLTGKSSSSKLPLDDGASVLVSKAEPGHPTEKNQFNSVYLCSVNSQHVVSRLFTKSGSYIPINPNH